MLICFCRAVDSFMKKGINMQEAQKRQRVYEEHRKLNIDMLLREIALEKSRLHNRKANSVLK